MLKLISIFIFFTLAMAGSRYPISKSVKLTDMKGRQITVDSNSSQGFEIEEVGQVTSYIRLFDEKGVDAGVYSVSAEELQELMKARIQAGLKAIPEGGKKKEPGCCDVEPPKKGREPAVVEVVEPDPIVVPKKVPIPETAPRKETKIPIPTPNPRRKAEEEASPPAADLDRETGGSEICQLYKKFKTSGVPEAALKQALTYYQNNPSKIRKKGVISIADYSSSSRKERFYILDMKTGTVKKEKVSHGGSGSKVGDPNHDGVLDACKRPNGSRTNLTRDGFFTTGNIGYSSGKSWPKYSVGSHKNKKGKTVKDYQNFMALVSRSPGVNDDASGYVMHEAHYNNGGNAVMGRSHGCPAFVPGEGYPVWKQIQGGSLYYSYAPVCKDDHKKVLKQVAGWESLCK